MCRAAVLALFAVVVADFVTEEASACHRRRAKGCCYTASSDCCMGGGAPVGEDKKKDNKIDVEAIKMATQKLLGKGQVKLDLSYITEEFVLEAMKKAKPVSQTNNGKMTGNHPYQDPRTNYLYWQYGRAPNEACGMDYWTYCPKNYATFPEGTCAGGELTCLLPAQSAWD